MAFTDLHEIGDTFARLSGCGTPELGRWAHWIRRSPGPRAARSDRGKARWTLQLLPNGRVRRVLRGAR